MITSADVSGTCHRPGRFITFEGVDGAGKSTHARRLAERLGAAHLKVVLTREPGGSPGAEAIRALVLDAPAGRWDGLSEALLLYAARREHVEQVIRPALAAGAWVICDRFIDSSHAYQGQAGGVPDAFLDALDAAVLGGLRPDLTLILDLPISEAVARTRGRPGPGRFEERGEAFQDRVRRAFHDIAVADPDRCRVIDARPEADAVAAAIWREIVPLIDVPKEPAASDGKVDS